MYAAALKRMGLFGSRFSVRTGLRAFSGSLGAYCGDLPGSDRSELTRKAEVEIVSRLSKRDVAGGLKRFHKALDRGLPLSGEGLWIDSLGMGFHEWVWMMPFSDTQKSGLLIRLKECGVLPCSQELGRAKNWLSSNTGPPLYLEWASRWFSQMETFAVSIQARKYPEMNDNLGFGFQTLIGEFGLSRSDVALLGVGTGDVESQLVPLLSSFSASDVNPYLTQGSNSNPVLGEIEYASVQSLSRLGSRFSLGIGHNLLSASALRNVTSLLMNPVSPRMVFSQDKLGSTDLVCQKLDAVREEISKDLIVLVCDGPEGQELHWVTAEFAQELLQRFPRSLQCFMHPNFLGLPSYLDRIKYFDSIYNEIVQDQSLVLGFREFSQFVYDNSVSSVDLNDSRDGFFASDIQAGARLCLETAGFDLLAQQASSLGYTVDQWSHVSVRPIPGDRVFLGGLFGQSLLEVSDVNRLYGDRVPGEGGRVVHSMRALVLQVPDPED